MYVCSVPRVIKVAKDYVGSVSFAVSDKAVFGQDLDQLGSDKAAEVVAGLFDAKGQKYSMTESFRCVCGCECVCVLIFMALWMGY